MLARMTGKKKRDFRKKLAKYMYVLRWCSLLYKVSSQRLCNKNEFYNKSERLIQKINTPTIDIWWVITISKSRKCQR